MTATAEDTITVPAETKEDAADIARRQWQGFGFRVLHVIEVRPAVLPGRWRVTADVEVRR